MSNSSKRLPDSELQVMQAVWDCTPPVSGRMLQEALHETYPIAQTTLLTLLSRLVEKGFLKADREGRGKSYIPLISRQEYLADQSRGFIRTLCGGNISTFAAALCDSGLSREELSELRDLLERDGL